ncbi:MAG: hypothetical protein JEZ11_11740 [Desulfobacterales bacterium]|nr:hypothetical protein [Desulfobacterales bacterium]
MKRSEFQKHPQVIDRLTIDAISKVLEIEGRVIFAYLYGSMVAGEDGNDIDIAIYSNADASPHELSADVKVNLYKETGISPDRFDIRIVNTLVEQGDVFALLYLRNVLQDGRIIVDKNLETRGDFLERYGLKFRECEGLMQEVLA